VGQWTRQQTHERSISRRDLDAAQYVIEVILEFTRETLCADFVGNFICIGGRIDH
jgi:hypothetical protein